MRIFMGLLNRGTTIIARIPVALLVSSLLFDSKSFSSALVPYLKILSSAVVLSFIVSYVLQASSLWRTNPDSSKDAEENNHSRYFFFDMAVTTFALSLHRGIHSPFLVLLHVSLLGASLSQRKRRTLAPLFFALLCYILLLVGHNINSSLHHWTELTTLDTLTTAFFHCGTFVVIMLLGSRLNIEVHQERERVRVAESRLARAQVIHEQILNSLPSGVVTLGKNGFIHYVNQRAYDLAEQASKHSAGGEHDFFAPIKTNVLGAQSKHPIQDFSAELSAESLKFLQELGSIAPCRRFDHYHTTPGGAELLFGGSVTSIDHLDQALVVFQDVTRFKELQKKAQREEHFKSLGALSASLAHEIRNPLAGMKASLELLRPNRAGLYAKGQSVTRSETDEENERLFSMALNEVERLSTLVSGFLNYARPPECSPASLNLESLIKECIKLHELSCVYPIVFETPLQTECMIQSDASALRQIMLNLFRNASEEIGACPQDSQHQVLVRLVNKAENYLVEVHDSGRGIPDERKNTVFEPFTTDKVKGTGLGLATCFQLSSVLGANLSVHDSPILGGACFSLVLPGLTFQDSQALKE